MSALGFVLLLIGGAWSLARELRDAAVDDARHRVIGPPEITIAVALALLAPRLVELLT
jgi:hypothetical protein